MKSAYIFATEVLSRTKGVGMNKRIFALMCGMAMSLVYGLQGMEKEKKEDPNNSNATIMQEVCNKAQVLWNGLQGIFGQEDKKNSTDEMNDTFETAEFCDTYKEKKSSQKCDSANENNVLSETTSSSYSEDDGHCTKENLEESYTTLKKIFDSEYALFNFANSGWLEEACNPDDVITSLVDTKSKYLFVLVKAPKDIDGTEIWIFSLKNGDFLKRICDLPHGNFIAYDFTTKLFVVGTENGVLHFFNLSGKEEDFFLSKKLLYQATSKTIKKLYFTRIECVTYLVMVTKENKFYINSSTV